MALAFQGFLVFVPAENVFVELHVGSAESLEEVLHLLGIVHHFFGEIIRVDVDADGADDAVFFPDDRHRRALELSGADVQLVIELIFVRDLALLQVDDQVRGAIAQISAGDIVLQHDERVRRVRQIVEQDLDAKVRKRFADQPRNPGKVLQVFAGVVGDLFALVLVEQSRVNLLLRRLELGADVVLFADEDKLARGGRVVVAQEVMHPEPEIVQVKLGEIVAVDGVRVKVVLLEPATEFSALLVLTPGVTGREENDRRDD